MSNQQEKGALGSPKTASELLDLYFLDMRCALLETAATLDRIERSEGGSDAFGDPRLKNIREACDLLKNIRGNRATEFLTLFSDPID